MCNEKSNVSPTPPTNYIAHDTRVNERHPRTQKQLHGWQEMTPHPTPSLSIKLRHLYTLQLIDLFTMISINKHTNEQTHALYTH